MEKIKINLLTAIFLSLCFIVLVNDYFTYIFDWNYYVSMLVSTCVSSPFFYFVSKKFTFVNDFEKIDLLFYLLLFAVFAITIVFPDRMYDTLNYHLYSQVYPFNSIWTGDFFPNRNINSYTYSFTDRVFYPFRLLFGYRLGLIFNYLCLIVIYYQVKRIVKMFGLKKSFLASLIAIGSIFTFSILDLVDVYYVDYFSIIFLLEIFANVICKKNYNINTLFIYMALLSGMAFCAKISNAYFIIFFFVLFLGNYWSKKNDFHISSLFYAAFFFLFPFFIYMLFTYLDTGNPFFPFYNTIFHSDLYSNSNWMDTRFGPASILERIFWPILILFYKNRTIDIGIVEPMWTMGYLVCIFYIIQFVFRKIRKQKVDFKHFFMISLFGLYVIWSNFVLGYTRYGLFLLILSTVAFGIFLYEMFKKRSYLLFIIALLGCIYNIGYNGYNYVEKADYWSSNNVFGNGVDSYVYNLGQMFKKDETINFPEKSAWGVINANSGFMMFLNDQLPIYSLFMSAETDTAEKMLQERLSSLNHLYTLGDAIELKAFIDNLNETGYLIKDYYGTYIPSYINYNNYLYVFEIEKNNTNIQNNYEKFIEKNIEFAKKKDLHISYWIGLNNQTKNASVEGYKTQLVSIKNNQEEVLYSTPLTNDGKLYFVNEIIDSREIDKLFIRIVDENEEIITDRVLTCVNLNLS